MFQELADNLSVPLNEVLVVVFTDMQGVSHASIGITPESEGDLENSVIMPANQITMCGDDCAWGCDWSNALIASHLNVPIFAALRTSRKLSDCIAWSQKIRDWVDQVGVTGAHSTISTVDSIAKKYQLFRPIQAKVRAKVLRSRAELLEQYRDDLFKRMFQDVIKALDGLGSYAITELSRIKSDLLADVRRNYVCTEQLVYLNDQTRIALTSSDEVAKLLFNTGAVENCSTLYVVPSVLLDALVASQKFTKTELVIDRLTGDVPTPEMCYEISRLYRSGKTFDTLNATAEVVSQL